MVFDESDITLLTVIYCFAGVTGVLGNFAVLTSIFCRRRSRISQCHIFIVSLAATDFLTCLLCGPYYIRSLHVASFFESQKLAYDLCVGILVVTYSLAINSILSLTLLSLDRYCAVVLPFWYKKRVTKTKCVIAFIFVWVYSFLIVLPPTFARSWIRYENEPGSPCGFQWKRASSAYLTFNITVNVIIPALIVSVTNAIVFKTARQQNLKTRPIDVRLSQHEQQKDVPEGWQRKFCYGQICQRLRGFLHKLSKDNPSRGTNEGRGLKSNRFRKQKNAIGLVEAIERQRKMADTDESESENKGNVRLEDTMNAESDAKWLAGFSGYSGPCFGKGKERNTARRSVFTQPEFSSEKIHSSRPGLETKTRPPENLGLELRRVISIESFEEDKQRQPGDHDESSFLKDSSFVKSGPSSPSLNRGDELNGIEKIASLKLKVRHSSKPRTKNLAKAEMKLALATISLAITFLITWFPFVALRVLKSSTSLAISDKAVNYSSAVAFTNAAWNPYVILLTRKEIYRGAVSVAKKIFSKLCCRNSERKNNVKN